MSYLFTDNIGYKDGNLDAFGRLRSSSPTGIFDSQLQYDKQPLLWEDLIVGSATSTHLPDESAVDMSVTTADGDSVIRQTYEYFRYQPGKSQLILLTTVFGTGQSGTTKLIGYGDDRDGIFVGQDGSGLFILLRSSTSGIASDVRKIYQTDWDLDTFDGNGNSKITLDPTKTQIIVIDLEWLGVGRVRVGFNIDGVTTYAHQFLNANRDQTKVYMKTANLPVRYEITNTQVVSNPATLKNICSSVISEGGSEETLSYPFSEEMLGVSVPQGSTVVFSTRMKSTFGGQRNRAKFEPVGYETLATGGKIITQLIYNGTVNGGTWVDVDDNSIMQINTTATGITGGLKIGTSVIAGSAKNTISPAVGRSVSSRLPFGTGIAPDSDSGITLTLVAYSPDTNVTGDFTFQWEELR